MSLNVALTLQLSLICHIYRAARLHGLSVASIPLAPLTTATYTVGYKGLTKRGYAGCASCAATRAV